MEKQKTTVRVAGKDYALVSTDSPEHLNRVAAYVDRQMTETMRSGRIPANTAAVLTALNLADDLMRAQDEVNRLRRELGKAVKAFLFGDVIAGMVISCSFYCGAEDFASAEATRGLCDRPLDPFAFACQAAIFFRYCGYGGQCG